MAAILAARAVMPIAPTATYLYCVCKSGRRPSLARMPKGLPGATAPAAHKVTGSLWLIAAEVPLDVYGPAALEPRLRDLDWVSHAALAHEAVIEHFTAKRSTTVVPAKLFTMFSSTAKAVENVAGRRAPIERVMKHIAGCDEWGLRITRRPGTPAVSEAPRLSSGSAFLAARKAARDAVVNARTEAAAAAEEAYARLARHARDAVLSERRQEPGTNPPVLEAAFLVTSAARTRFTAEARRQATACTAAGAEMSLSGPWPAYNFIGNPT